MKKNEHSIQNSTTSSRIFCQSPDIKEYRDELGEKEYRRQYHSIYSHTDYLLKNDIRYSGDDKKPDLDKIKEKYRKGVTDEILKEWLF